MTPPVVIVTGASRGLGAAAAAILAARGAAVVLLARSEVDLNDVAERIAAEGGDVMAMACDVSDAAACQRVIEHTIARYGYFDTIVNNAAVIHPIATIADSDPQAWAQNVLINLVGVFNLTHYALPHLRGRHGRVITVSSGAAVLVEAGWSAYSASKSGVNHFTRTLAAEEPSITTIAFRPGKVDTPMQNTIRQDGDAGMSAAGYAKFVGYHEAGELVSPFDVGHKLAALALHAPHEWTGEFINVTEERLKALVNTYLGQDT